MGTAIRFFLFAVIALGLGACEPKKEKSYDHDPLDSQYRMIDRGDYDGAIRELEAMLQGQNTPRVREALASAYAARAGLFIENYWGFLVGFRAPLLNVDRVNAGPTVTRARKILTQLNGDAEPTNRNAFGQLARFFGTLEIWADRIDKLPVVRGNARADLERALMVLDGTPSPGGRLYRALLGLVAFKSDIANGFEGWSRVEAILKKLDLSNPKSPVNAALLCQVDVKSFALWAGGIIARLSSTGSDVAVAFPSKRDEMNNAIVQSAQIARELQKAGQGGCF